MAHPIGHFPGLGEPAPARRALHIGTGARVPDRAPARARVSGHPPALELRGVTRSWRAGAGGCSAVVRALRGIDLAVHAGEVVALAGGAGAGKTTLLLCAAGLVRPEAGCIAGEAVGLASYVAGDGAWMPSAAEAIERGARALLLDVLDAPGLASPRAVAALAGAAAGAGLAVVVAARDPAALPAFASRLVTLAAGRVVASVEPLALVSGFVARRARTP